MKTAEGFTLEDQKVLDDFRADFHESIKKTTEEMMKVGSILPSGFLGFSNLLHSFPFPKLDLTGIFSISDLHKPSDSLSWFSDLDLPRPSPSVEARATDSLHDTIIRVFREQEVRENRRHKQQMVWVRAVFLVGAVALLLTLWQSGLFQFLFDAVMYAVGQLGNLVEYARNRWF